MNASRHTPEHQQLTPPPSGGVQLPPQASPTPDSGGVHLPPLPDDAPPRPRAPRTPRGGRPDGMAPNLKEAPPDVVVTYRTWVLGAICLGLYGVFVYLSTIEGGMHRIDAYVRFKVATSSLWRFYAEQVGMERLSELVPISSLLIVLAAAVIWIILANRAVRGGIWSRRGMTAISFAHALTPLHMATTDLYTIPGDHRFFIAAGWALIFSGMFAVSGIIMYYNRHGVEFVGLPTDAELDRYEADMRVYKRELRVWLDYDRKRREAERAEKRERQRERLRRILPASWLGDDPTDSPTDSPSDDSKATKR